MEMEMKSYDAFAKFYDFVMGDRMEETVHIAKIIKQYNSSAKKLLDLGCGTGTFLKYFLDQGLQVEGVDLSEGMLAIARQKLPTVQLSRQDTKSFSLPNKFDVITCLFDSINHLVEYSDWESVFSRALFHLNKGGLFIFDINTLNKLEMLTKTEPIVKEFNNKKIIMTITHNHETYNWNIKILEKKDTGEKSIKSEDIQEQSFPVQRVLNSLKKLFSEVIVFDQNGNEVSETSLRVYFVCRAV